jgi:hypothetical protein
MTVFSDSSAMPIHETHVLPLHLVHIALISSLHLFCFLFGLSDKGVQM